MRAASCASSYPAPSACPPPPPPRPCALVAGLGRAVGRARLAAVGRALRLRGAGRTGRGPRRQPDPLRLAGARRTSSRRPIDGPQKTSIVFWGFNDSSPGALVDVLRELSDREINLTKIESRPRRVRLGHYMFFADLEGHARRAQRGGGPRGAQGAGRDAAGARLVPRLDRLADRDLLATLPATVAALPQAVPAASEAGESDPAPLSALPGGRPGRRSTSSGRVLVLNASYEPINVCTVRRAAVLVLKDRAEILERGRLGPARGEPHAPPADRSSGSRPT